MKSVSVAVDNGNLHAKLLDSGWHLKEVRRGSYTQFVLQPMSEKDRAVWTTAKGDPELTLDKAVERYYSIQ